MQIIKKILLILSIIILLIAAVGILFFSKHIHVDRSTLVNQKQAATFNYIQDLQNWNKWSPWSGIDPNAKYIFEGPQAGQGASMKWQSENKNVGNGSLTITQVKPDSVIMIDLNFMDNGIAKSSFICAPEGDGTKLTWNFDVDAGYNPLLRIMGTFMDGMLGAEYEKGLRNIKMQLESIHAPAEIKAE